MANEKSRSTYTIYNFSVSMGGQLLTIVLRFITRTVFIHTLGGEYLGIDGLFDNILSMLSLAEFGVGSAIVFKLYEPIATSDYSRIRALMKVYKVIYMGIGIVIAVLGVILIPFLPVIISDYDRLADLHINAVLIYILYLIKTVSSYLFFAYKASLIRAHQKEYILYMVHYFLTVIATILQIISLVILRNFTVFVFISLSEIIIENMIGAVLANRLYPYITEHENTRINRTEIMGIAKDCSALFLYRVNGVVLKATDNIVISMFLGIEAVALYANYVIFYTTVNSLFAKIYNAVSHSLGNLHTTHDNTREYRVFKAMTLVTVVMAGTAGACIFVASDEFVDAWVGSKWVLGQPFSALLGLEVYSLGLRHQLAKYRTSMGLFQQAKYRPIASMIINLVVSVVLVNKLGITGVLIGTVAADWLTTMWYDPIIICKYGFQDIHLAKKYFKKLAYYTLEIISVAAIDMVICRHVCMGYGWLSVLAHGMICGVTVPMVILGITYNTEEGQYIWKLLWKEIRLVLRKLGIK